MKNTLTCALLPSGRISLQEIPAPHAALPAAVLERVSRAFERGAGHGLLHLGVVEWGADLPPALSFWRELGRMFVIGACGAIQPTDPDTLIQPQPDLDALARLSQRAPPMRGAEALSAPLLERLWAALGEALEGELSAHDEGLQGYLNERHSIWHVAGRICLHLAENQQDPDLPFAFIATYARQAHDRERVVHVPLSRALQEFAGAGNKRRLLALLSPLKRAAEESALIRELIDSGDVYHPLAWSVEEAYAFLSEATQLERAGLVVRLPDWWRSRQRARPVAAVTVGEKAPSLFGPSGLLDFTLEVSLGGEALSEEEAEALLEGCAGLRLIKGRWVEVDPEKLKEVLAHWRQVRQQVHAGGVSFAQAMRMLAGVEAGRDAQEDEARPMWSEVIAGDWLKGKLEALRAPKVKEVIEQGAGLNATLRPYQEVGAQWLWDLHALRLGGCLADDMGLGKTIQVIALLSMLKADDGHEGVDLLVVPASLVDNWVSELERFAPQLKPLIAHASKIPAKRLKALDEDEVRRHDVVITTYGTAIRLDWIQRRAWRCLALDEAQAIKNPRTKQARIIKGLTAQWRLALTGTPIENRLTDLWSLFDFLNPGLLGGLKDFDRSCKEMERRFDGYAPLRKLVGPYILRRLKTDEAVISDLPEKTEVIAHCLLSKRQAALYKDGVDDLAAALAEEREAGIARRGIVLSALLRFKQICDHPSLWLGDGEFKPDHSGKFKRLTALCEPIAARQEKALIFTQFREMTEPLSRHLAACFGRPGLVMHGGTPIKRRQGLVGRFQEDEEIPFMVLSLKVGGSGLNLTAANHVIHFDRWWNPSVENQATDRAFRIGQEKPVLVHKFLCKGTMEERIDRLINRKQRLSDEILTGDSGEVRFTELSDQELMDLVSLDMKRAVIS